MSRGLPPRGQVLELWLEDQKSSSAGRRAHLRVSKMKWHFNGFASSSRVKIETFIKLEHSTRDFPGTRQITCSSLEGTLRKWFLITPQTLFGIVDWIQIIPFLSWMLKAEFSSKCWEFEEDAERKMCLTECNLSKLGPELFSWTAGSFCFCIPTSSLSSMSTPVWTCLNRCTWSTSSSWCCPPSMSGRSPKITYFSMIYFNLYLSGGGGGRGFILQLPKMKGNSEVCGERVICCGSGMSCLVQFVDDQSVFSI